MKSRLNMLVTVPALVVAVMCLVRDESLVSFAKRVGGTYVFFSLLVAFLGSMWRMSLQSEASRVNAAARMRRPTEKEGKGVDGEETAEPVAAASAG